MEGWKWPEMDELGNLKDIKVTDFDRIREEDSSMSIVVKQEKQLQKYERKLRRECMT